MSKRTLHRVKTGKMSLRPGNHTLPPVKQPSLRVRAIAILAMLVVGLGASWLGAVTSLRCERATAAQVECRVQRRLLGLVPIRVERLAGVVRVETSAVIRSKGRTGTSGSARNPTGGTSTQVTLYNAQGQTLSTASAEDTYIIGGSAERIATNLTAFLDTPSARVFTAWQSEWLPLLIGGVFLFFPTLLVVGLLVRALQAVTRYGIVNVLDESDEKR